MFQVHSGKTKMTMEKPTMNEDVISIKNSDFPLSCPVFGAVGPEFVPGGKRQFPPNSVNVCQCDHTVSHLLLPSCFSRFV